MDIKRIKNIQRFYKIEFVSQVVDKRLARTPDMCMDDQQNIYFTCISLNIIVKYDRNMRFKWQTGSKGREKGKFNMPKGLDFANNDLYVVDSGNKRIQIFNRQGSYIGRIDADNCKRINFDDVTLVRVLNNRYIFIILGSKNIVYVIDKNPAELKYRFNWTTPIAV